MRAAAGPRGGVIYASAAPVLEVSPVSPDRRSRPTNGQNPRNVQDDGPGIDPDEIATLFSIDRPMVSTKLLRLPTRGALGNGLRVVAGAVLASSGRLVVYTRDRRIEVTPHDDRTTTTDIEVVDFPVGTRIEIWFGRAMPKDENALYWAEMATRIGHAGSIYKGKSSPHWVRPRFILRTAASGR